MKLIFKTIFLFLISTTAFAQAEDCRLDHLRTLYLSQVMGRIDHRYLCKIIGPTLGARIKEDLTTCIFTGLGQDRYSQRQVINVTPKYGISIPSDLASVGGIFSFHATGLLHEKVSVTEQEILVQTHPSSPVRTKIQLDLRTGRGVMESEDDALPELNVALPMKCVQLN